MLEHNADAVFIARIILSHSLLCTAAIVSPKYVLAAEACHIVNPVGMYFVHSGVRHLGAAKSHRVKDVHTRHRAALALFELRDAISFKNPNMNRPMPFYESNVRPDLPHLSIYAWDVHGLAQIKTHVSIVDRAQIPLLRGDQIVTDQTRDNIRVINDFRDFGAPLAVGHHLVGILTFARYTRDTFTLVHVGTAHYTWIMEHIRGDLENLANSLNQDNQK